MLKLRQKQTLLAAPLSVQSDVVLNDGGATDAESDASLLERLLEIIRRPPAGAIVMTIVHGHYRWMAWMLLLMFTHCVVGLVR